jgi:molybdopterin molybdotransferase
MISVEEALEKVLSYIDVLEAEEQPILNSLGLVLAQDIHSDIDIPPLDNSAMDGYALRFEDVKEASSNNPIRLEVIEDLPAGMVSNKTIGKGQAIRIMTGAAIPKGADTVVPVEDTGKEDGFALIFKVVPPGENIRWLPTRTEWPSTLAETPSPGVD